MKKITLLIMLFLCMASYGQIWKIASCGGGLTTNTYGPMNSVSDVNATSRTTSIYPASQLTGIAGKTLTAAYFNRLTTTGSVAGTPNFKIYLKETTSTDWGSASLDWAAAITGATLVYDSNPATAIGTAAGWKSFAFSNNFVYSGTANLAVIVEYSNTTASTTIGWEYEYSTPCISDTNNNTTKYSNNTTGTPAASLASSNYRRSMIGFDFNVSCNGPTGLAATNVLANTADINWVASTSTPANGYEYIVTTSSTAPLATATPTGTVGAGIVTKSLTGLTMGTPYYFWVRAICSSTDKSFWSAGTFATPCATIVPSYTQTFDAFPPNCWTRSGAGSIATGPTGTANGSWAADGFLNVGATGAVKINIYSTAANATGWLITPVVNMSAGNYRAKFKIGATMYSATTPVAAMGSDDIFVFASSQDGGTTWTAVNTWNTANTPSNTGSLYVVNLPTYTSATTKFAFFATSGTTNDNLDYEVFVDDFTVEAIPSCEAPINLRASGVTSTGATITWDVVTGSAGYQYVIDNVATNPTGAGIVASSNTFTTSTPLTGATTYYVHVRNNCGSEFSGWTTFSFTTLPSPPANDNCAGAVTLTPNANLTCTNIISATLAGATASGESTPTSVGVPDDDVWFKFVATSTRHRITISDVTGTPTDLVHELLGGSCGGGLYNLNISDPNVSNVSDLTIGETYYIRVFSLAVANNPSTNFKICIGTPPSGPVNDECVNAITLTVNANLACATVTAGTNAYASASAVATTSLSGTPNNDVWFKFVATNARHRISLANVVAVEGTSVDMAMGVYDGLGGCSDLAFKATSDPDTFDVSGLVVNNVYFVRVYGYSVAQTNFNICVGTLPPAPANDECANAIALTVNNNFDCTVVTAGTNAYASASSQATTSLSGTPNADVWYSFTATAAAHRVSLTNIVAVVGTSVDMAMGVYDATGGCGALTFKATSDPNTLDLTGLVPNTVYLVRVYGYSVAQATFNICIGTPPPPPANDLIANAAVLTESTTTACNNALAGTTTSATHSTEYACSTTDIDVWYTFTPASTGNYIFSRSIVSGTGNGYVSIYSGTPAALVRLNTSCSSTTFIQALTAGTIYYVSVSSTSTSPLSFNLCALLAPPAPANDLIANAAVLTESPAATCANALAGTTLSATHSAEYACSTTDVDVWYTFTPASTGNYIFSRAVVTGTGNGYVSIYSGTPAALVRLNANCTSTSFTQALTAGTTYYVSVSSTSAATLSFNLCTFLAPPAPSNDSCATPTALTAGSLFATNAIIATNLSATIQSGIADPTCGVSSFPTTGKDVWFSVNAPASGTLTVETGTDTGSALVDTAIQVYRGTCAALVSVGCNDDIASGTNIFSKLALTGLTAGEPLLVRVWSYGTTPAGTFKISAYDASLSAPTFDSASFKAYPNPVKDVLKLSYSQDMTSVSVFNLLGQQVINKSLNASEAQVDMSNLSAGTYLVKVVVDNQVKTIKVVKQ